MHRELICDAIQAKRLLEFRYKDEQWRVVEPHQVGATADGHELVLGWLVRAQAGSDQTGWRLYRTAEARDLRVLDETFVDPRPGFNPTARYFAVTHCSLVTSAGVRTETPQAERATSRAVTERREGDSGNPGNQ